MSIRVGWSRTTPRRHRPGRVAGGVHFLELYDGGRVGGNRHLVIGYVHYRRDDLERLRDKGQQLEIRVIGLLRFAGDVTPRLVEDAVASVRCTGMIVAPEPVRRHLQDKARAAAPDA